MVTLKSAKHHAIFLAPRYIVLLDPKKLPRRSVSKAAARGAFNATRAALAATIFAAAGALNARADGLKYIGS